MKLKKRLKKIKKKSWIYKIKMWLMQKLGK